MRCPRCQHENPAGQKFCGDCGTPLNPTNETASREPAYADLKRDLTEALARESATGEILRMVRDSPANEQAVFEAIVSSAWRLLGGFGGAFGGAVYRVVGEELHLAAYVSTNPTGDAALRSTFPRPLAFFSPPGEAIRGRAPVVLTDVDTDEWVPDDIRELIRKRGDRSGVWVPMMREGVALGAIGVTRSEPGSFGDEQISLLKTFADQAVIAIENVRLFKELREKNRALTHAHAQVTESLEQQTATSDILRVISSSPTDVQPVFDTIVRSAVRLCAGLFSALYQFDGELLHRVAQHNYTPEALEELYRVFPARPTRALFTGRAILARAVVHIPDSEVDPEHQHRALRRAIGWRSGLFVPMLREGAPIGVIEVARAEPGPFSDSEIALLETFADQAVIAIENVRLFTELQEKNGALTQAHAQVSESLEQRTATSEILRVISSSPTDVQPVFDSIAESAARLCDANDAEIYRVDGDVYRRVAHRGPVPIAGPLGEAYPISRGRPSSRAIIDRQTIHVHDQAAEIDSEFPDLKAWQPVAGVRTILATPMLRDGVALGVIVLRRTEVNPFSGKHIELLKTFADQAVIAIENVRLFTELEARNRDLAGALQRETATGEILRLISSSPTDVTPVFDGILRSAVRLAAADYGATLILDGEFLHLAASHGTTREWQKVAEHVYPLRVGPDSASGQAILERRAVFIEDAQASPLARVRDLARTMGYRSQLMVPMLRRDAAIGVLALVWQEAPEFPSGQLSLLQTFADQGVIAIENVRLFKELQEKNRALTETHAQVSEALDQQTATAEILRIISQSRTDVQPVFDAIALSATRLCGGDYASVFRIEGDQLVPMQTPMTAEHADFLRRQYPRPIDTTSMVGRSVIERRVVHVPDLVDPSAPPRITHETGDLIRRAQLTVPMLRNAEPVGVIAVSRREPGAFSEPQIELLKTFADQAVIAIENARLLAELQARTHELTRSVEQLTALGDVGRAVSSTLDLETVLTTIVSRAVQLSGLDGGVVFEYDESAEEFVQRAATEASGALAEARRATRIRKGEGVVGRTALALEPVQVPDITLPGAHGGRLREILIKSGVRAVLAVPMVCEGRLIGSLGVTRNRPGDFPAETTELLRTFATQSALAIQNARLFHEIADKSRQLEVASQHKSEFLANMSHELRTPLNAIIGFSEVLMQRMFGELNTKQEEYLGDIYESGRHLLSLINDILDLSKIEAGRMELELTEFDLPTAIESAMTLVRERATRRGIALQKTLDGRVGRVQADERKVRQVVLNLLSNAIKFTPEGGRIEVRAVPVDGSVEVSVADTGVGIAPEDQEAVFEEFRQVGSNAAKQEGTGLGLALSRKFVELHGGAIWVTSAVGAGSTFTFRLPVRP